MEEHKNNAVLRVLEIEPEIFKGQHFTIRAILRCQDEQINLLSWNQRVLLFQEVSIDSDEFSYKNNDFTYLSRFEQTTTFTSEAARIETGNAPSRPMRTVNSDTCVWVSLPSDYRLGLSKK